MIAGKLLLMALYRPLQRRFSAFRSRRHWRRMAAILAKLHTHLKGRVLSGPFGGLIYPLELGQPDRCPMLLGVYEQELHSTLERLRRRTFTQIIDIGCAEGYYAAGLALLFPKAQIYAFDIDKHAQARCQTMCAANALEQKVNIMGECTPAWLEKNLDDKCLVFCDCEGGELSVLQPALAPVLKTVTIIIELHDNICPGLSEQLLPRFSESHQLELISQNPVRDTSRLSGCGLDKAELADAVREYRTGIQQWAVLEPRCSHGESGELQNE